VEVSRVAGAVGRFVKAALRDWPFVVGRAMADLAEAGTKCPAARKATDVEFYIRTWAPAATFFSPAAVRSSEIPVNTMTTVTSHMT
jgi:hypothetical protein